MSKVQQELEGEDEETINEHLLPIIESSLNIDDSPLLSPQKSSQLPQIDNKESELE